MITALLTGVLIAAAPPYVEIPLSEVYAGSLNVLNGETSLNARRVDINDDQHADLLLPDRVLFQRDGRYVSEEAVEIPDVALSPAVDVFSGTVYLKFPHALKAYRYRDDAWETVLDMEMQWPLGTVRELTESTETPVETDDSNDAELSESAEEESATMRPSFERFVYDIDEDGIPELLFPLQDGLYIYGLSDKQYLLLTVLDIFPKTKLIPLDEVLPSASLERGLSFPDQHLVFHCSIDKGVVTLLTKVTFNDGRVQFSELR